MNQRMNRELTRLQSSRARFAQLQEVTTNFAVLCKSWSQCRDLVPPAGLLRKLAYCLNHCKILKQVSLREAVRCKNGLTELAASE
jgi:predicted TIM-barrel fold metal-dependent hydrolase